MGGGGGLIWFSNDTYFDLFSHVIACGETKGPFGRNCFFHESMRCSLGSSTKGVVAVVAKASLQFKKDR